MAMEKERCFTAQEALKRWQVEITQQGWTEKLEKLTPHNPATHLCQLFGTDGSKLTHGIGKGLSCLQSNLSARYECLEHYTCTLSGANQNYLRWDSLQSLEAANESILYSDITDDFFTEGRDILLMPWIELRSMIDSKIHLLPLVFKDAFYMEAPHANDKIDYGELDICVTNNGSAIGGNINEALVHSLLEQIERDAVALFLLRTFIKSNPDKLLIVDNESLPIYLLKIIKAIEQRYQVKVVICDLSSPFEIPAFSVYFVGANCKDPVIGHGASLDSAYAIERALLEALQSYDMMTFYEDPDSYESIDEQLEEWPTHLQAANPNIKKIIDEKHFELLSFNDLSQDVSDLPDDINDYLKQIVSSITKEKFDIQMAVPFQTESGITTVITHIPGLETFFQAEQGYPAVPTARGIAYLKSA